MAISATFQFADSGGGVGAALAKNFWNTYTVLDFDYTLEREYDKTGRPSSRASITAIKVTIRGIKQATTPFHDWIKNPDQKMSGDIKIFDSTGIVSSMMQGVAGTDQIVDWGELTDTPIDMMGDSMGIAMDDATEYNSDDIYGEMSHADLVKCASSKGVTITDTDTDDNIRNKIRVMDEVSGMNNTQLKSYCTKNSISTSDFKSDDDYKRAVYYHKLKEKEKDKKADNAMGHLHDLSDTYKKATSNVAKSAVSNAVTKATECARCISFTNAYCVSLREHFENHPKSEGELDKSYPWIIEIGIRPEKVDFIGEQVFGGSAFNPSSFKFF